MLRHCFVHHHEIRFQKTKATHILVKNLRKEFDAFLLHVFSDSHATVFECGVVIRVDRDLIQSGEIDPLRHKVLQ